MAAVKALQQWCKIQCEGYRDVSITNMTTSFRDGLAFCALLHKHRPDLIDFDSLSKENVYENNQLAFRVAEEQLSIPALLDAEDMVALKVPDRLSILTYVSQYYNYFHGRSPIGGLAGVKRPAEEPIDGTSGRKNQPVSAKVFSSTKPEPDTKRDVAVERSEKPATINRNCSICNKQVHLVQRHLVDGKLYHRNCFKCSECFNILLSGTYKPGKEPKTFICKSHQNTHKPPPTQVTPPAPSSQTAATSKPTNTFTTLKPTNIFSTSKPTNTFTTSNPTNTFTTLKPTNISSTFKPTNTFTTSNPIHTFTTLKPTNISSTSNPTNISSTSNPTNTLTTSNTSTSKSTPKDTMLKNVGKDSTPQKKNPFWQLNKSVGSPDPTATPKSTPTATFKPKPTAAPSLTPTSAPRYKPNTSSQSVTVVVKSPAEQKVSSETPKGPSSSVLRNLEARQRFFESSSTPVSPGPATAATEKPRAGGAGAAGGAGKGKQLLGANDWIKDKKKEKENDGDKEKAKSVISKFVGDETSRSSSSPSPHTPDTKTSVSPVPSANKTPKTRVLLKPPAMDLELSTNHESETAPSGWRSLLKPVAKNTKPRSSQESTPTIEPKTSNSTPRPWETPSKISSPSSTPSQTTNSSSTKPLSAPSRDSEEEPQDHHVESSSQKPLKPGYIPKEEILKELKEIEVKLNDLEKKGIELEQQLRQCEKEDQEDVLTNDLMVDWFSLIRSKQVLIRRESELVYIGRSQDLEEEHKNVEAELRKLMEKAERFKTSQDKKREEELMDKLVEIVNDRNAIVDGLDEDRLREEEEDEQLNKMIENLDIKKEKKKRLSMSKLFSKKSKAES